MEAQLKPLTSFILPGGTSAAAHLHMARTTCRRAERAVVHLARLPDEFVAPISGVVTDRAEALHVGRWINKELSLAYVVDPAGEELHALASETDVGYLRSGQSARFIPEGVERPSVDAQVVEIRDADEHSFTVPYLASLYGGEVPVREDVNHKLRPETSVYRITLRLTGPPPRWNQAVRGMVLVEGPRISFAQRVWEKGVRVLIRESGV